MTDLITRLRHGSSHLAHDATMQEAADALAEARAQIENLRASVLDMVQRQERELQAWKDALWRACGDDEQMVNEYVDSQRMPA